MTTPAPASTGLRTRTNRRFRRANPGAPIIRRIDPGRFFQRGRPAGRGECRRRSQGGEGRRPLQNGGRGRGTPGGTEAPVGRQRNQSVAEEATTVAPVAPVSGGSPTNVTAGETTGPGEAAGINPGGAGEAAGSTSVPPGAGPGAVGPASDPQPENMDRRAKTARTQKTRKAGNEKTISAPRRQARYAGPFINSNGSSLEPPLNDKGSQNARHKIAGEQR